MEERYEIGASSRDNPLEDQIFTNIGVMSEVIKGNKREWGDLYSFFIKPLTDKFSEHHRALVYHTFTLAQRLIHDYQAAGSVKKLRTRMIQDCEIIEATRVENEGGSSQDHSYDPIAERDYTDHSIHHGCRKSAPLGEIHLADTEGIPQDSQKGFCRHAESHEDLEEDPTTIIDKKTLTARLKDGKDL